MIITGNSNVSSFRQRGLVASAEKERVEVFWAGALKIEHFENGHPAGGKVRELFRNDDGWKLLSIGIHDIYDLCQAAGRGRLEEAIETAFNRYCSAFREFNESGRFAWLVFPQPLHETSFPGMSSRDMLAIARDFNKRVEDWCLAQKIKVINPLRRIIGPDGEPHAGFLQKDGIHLNVQASQLYLDEIGTVTGVKLAFQEGAPPFEPENEPESFCSLLLSSLDIPFGRTMTARGLEKALVDFVTDLLQQKGLELDIDTETELVDSGLMDSLALVETYTFAANAIRMDLEFDVNLRDLNTIRKICAFLTSRIERTNEEKSSLSFTDFLTSLRGVFADPAQRPAILEAEGRIANMGNELTRAFIDNFSVVSENMACSYGVIYLWLALISAAKDNLETAELLLAQAGSAERRFPSNPLHLEYYADVWSKKSGNKQEISNFDISPADAGPGSRISVITVCFNAERTIEAALRSVLAQTCRDIEYIVIDGGSTDGTLAILDRYRSNIAVLVSEPDKGIYDAMNKGIGLATGEIVYFLNADDTLSDENVFGNVTAAFRRFPLADVIYGDARLVYPDGSTAIATYPQVLSWDHFKDRTLCHQSVFTKREAFNRVGLFDTSYRLAADFAWIVDSIWNHDLNYQHTEQILANFSMGGSHGSADNSRLLEWERRMAIDRYIGKRFDFIGSYQRSKATVFALTIGDPVFPACLDALRNQDYKGFNVDVIENIRPVSVADQEMMRRCRTDYFIKLDEDMILNPDGVRRMQAYMDAAPADVGMICFHLYDDDREMPIQGIKIFRAGLLEEVRMKDVRASDMELLDQLEERKIKWVLHDEIVGRHGTFYTPETIYLRYKSMYEKDISVWNVLTSDIRKKADKFRESGDPLQLFALLGAVHGIIGAPFARDVEAKDFLKYNLKELELFKQLFDTNPPPAMIYDPERKPKAFHNQPLPSGRVKWNFPGKEADAVTAPAARRSPQKPAPAGSRILIACTHFWPSIGGVETIAGELGSHLVERGHRVEVATWARSDRTNTTHRGVEIIELEMTQTEKGVPAWVMQLRSLALSGEYAACILLADPQNLIIWSLEGAEMPAGTRLLIQPLINEEGFGNWYDNQAFRSRLAAILKKADAVIAISRDGAEMRFFREEGITPLYIPNATERLTGKAGFRTRHGIPEGLPLFLHVANLWPVKNHDGLLRTLREMPGDWRLVMIGHPSGDAEYVERVRAEVARDLRVLLIPGLPTEEIGAAVAAADIFLLASHGEVSPVTIIEAMSHGKPWLATPACGAVHDFAGGVIAPLERFPEILGRLLQRPDLMASLGSAGQDHWQGCFTWRRVTAAWEELIQTGALNFDFGMPAAAADEMKSITGEINMRTPEQRPGAPLVSVIVPTHNRPDMLVATIRSILNQTWQNYEIIVVNDAGVDVEGIVNHLNRDGKITYARHARNRGLAAARNTGIKLARGKYIAYLDDDDLFYPEHLETLVTFLEGSACKVAYTDAHRAHQAMDCGRYAIAGRDLPYSFDFDYDAILVNNFVPVLCFMHEKSCVDEAGLFDESMTTHEDWDMWIRMSRLFRFAHLKKVTCEFTWRQDGSTMTSSKKEDFIRTARMIYEKHRQLAADKPAVLEGQRKALAAREPAGEEKEQQRQVPRQGAAVQPAASAGKESDLVARQLEQADKLVKEGKLSEALTGYQSILGMDSNNHRAMTGIGVIRLLEGKRDEAGISFDRALMITPDDPKALCGAGMVEAMKGRVGAAFDCFSRALDSDPENLTALGELVKCAYQLELLTDAERHVDNYLRYHPADLDILFSQAGIQFRVGKSAEALDNIEKLLIFAPEYEGGQELKEKIETMPGLNQAPAYQYQIAG